MLTGLRTIHRPTTISEAARLLSQPDVFPLYGGGAALVRFQQHGQIEAAADLAGVVSDKCELRGDTLFLGSAATLEAIAAFDRDMRPAIEADMPNTLRNAFTLGDVLLECPDNSLFLGLLYGLGARLDTPERGDSDVIELGRWCAMSADQRRAHLIQSVLIPHYGETRWRWAFEKVSRTPKDAAIVGAVGFAYAGEPDPGSYSIVVGVDTRPQRYQPGLKAVISDYKGSAEYRTEMARVLSQRARERAEQLAR